jgi:hypothetical protein
VANYASKKRVALILLAIPCCFDFDSDFDFELDKVDISAPVPPDSVQPLQLAFCKQVALTSHILRRIYSWKSIFYLLVHLAAVERGIQLLRDGVLV